MNTTTVYLLSIDESNIFLVGSSDEVICINKMESIYIDRYIVNGSHD